jgi:hypothetical protein
MPLSPHAPSLLGEHHQNALKRHSQKHGYEPEEQAQQNGTIMADIAKPLPDIVEQPLFLVRVTARPATTYAKHAKHSRGVQDNRQHVGALIIQLSDDNAHDGGPEDPRKIHNAAGIGHRALQLVWPHHSRCDRHPRGHDEGKRTAGNESGAQQMPKLQFTHEHQREDEYFVGNDQRLAGEHELPALYPVGHRTAYDRGENHRNSHNEVDIGKRGCRAGEIPGQEGARKHLAIHGYKEGGVTQEQPAKLRDGEDGEGAGFSGLCFCGVIHCGLRSCFGRPASIATQAPHN